MNTKIAILPSGVPIWRTDASPSSSEPLTFLRLPHPRTLRPALFLPYSDEESTSKLLEVQQIKPEVDKERCWFVDQEVVSDGTLIVITPFDPLFLLLGLLSSIPAARTSTYFAESDLFETLSEVSFGGNVAKKGGEDEDEDDGKDMAEEIVRFGKLACTRTRLFACCDTQDHEGETRFRLSRSKALAVLREKVDTLAKNLFGALESTQLKEETAESGDTSSKPFPTVSRGLTREGAGDGKGFSEELQTETRQRSAIGILTNYLPPKFAHDLLQSYEFPALKLHESTHVESSVLSSTYLPGRSSSSSTAPAASSSKAVPAAKSSFGGGSAAAEREKKRKAEDARHSRGVKELRNVSKKGMKTLEEMFGAKRKSPRKAPPK